MCISTYHTNKRDSNDRLQERYKYYTERRIYSVLQIPRFIFLVKVPTRVRDKYLYTCRPTRYFQVPNHVRLTPSPYNQCVVGSHVLLGITL